MESQYKVNNVKSSIRIFYDKRIPAHELSEHKDLLSSLARGETTHGANVEKLKNHDVFSIRTNKKKRILFTYRVINGINHIVVLEILKNHKYDSSRFLQKHVLAKYLEKNQDALETIVDADFEPANLIQINNIKADDTTILFTPAHENNGTYLVLDEVQETSLTARTPMVIEGPPGSGKTSLAVVLLKQATENNQRVLYVTQSKPLADKINTEWMASPQFVAGSADVLAYQALNEGLQEEGKKTFETWFTAFLKEKIKDKKIASRFAKEIDRVYEEFRIISGYTKEEYTSSGGIGQKQGLYNELEDRKWLYTVFTLWKHYLHSNNIKLSEFYEFAESLYEKYDLVIVDESQDFSHGQLQNLSKLTKNKNIVYCIDPRQNLHDENPKLIYLKKLLTNNETNLPPNVVQLSTHYRCKKNIMDFALVFNQLRIELGPKNKSETKIADSSILGGIVKWVEPKDNAALLKLQQMQNDANVCVVTQKEFIQEVKDKLGITQVFTPDQVKGLEYKTVILYKILNTNTLREVNKVLGQPLATENEMYSAALSACFVAATRAMDDLYVVQNEDRFNNHIVKKLKEKLPISSNVDSTPAAPQESTKEEWEVRAKFLVQNGNLEQAQSIISKHLDIKDPAQMNTLLGLWDPNIKSDSPSEKKEAIEEKEEKETNSAYPSLHINSGHRKKSSPPKKPTLKNPPPVKTVEIKTTPGRFIKSLSIHDAVKSASMAILQDVLNTKRKMINTKDADGCTPLYIAVSMGLIDKVRMLLKVKPKANLDLPDNKGITPLIRAIINRDSEIALLLLNAGADPNKSASATPLDYASRLGNIRVVKSLLDYGAGKNLYIDKRVLSLYLAAKEGHADIITLLLEANVNPENGRGSNDDTALHQACIGGHLDAVKVLLGSEANPNLQDDEGFTPLHRATLHGHLEIVIQLLHNKRVIEDLKTKEGQTVLDLARLSGNAKLIDLLAMNTKLKKLLRAEDVSYFDEAPSLLLPMFNLLGIKNNSYVHITQSVESKLLNMGLQYTEVPADNHCLYHAVGMQIGKKPQKLRNLVADCIEKSKDTYREIIMAELENRTMKTIDEYIDGIRGSEWGGDLEISILMRIFNRPIHIYGKEGDLINGANIVGEGKPVYLYYNGDSHYDALLERQPLKKSEEKHSICAR